MAKVTPATHNRYLKRGHQRARRLEPVLANILAGVLDRAADEAARNFTATATRHLVAAAGPAPQVTEQSAMVAIYPLPDEAAALAQPDGILPEIIHCTMVFLGEITEERLAEIAPVVEQVAAAHVPRVGIVGGLGTFSDNGDGWPSIVTPDVPGLEELRHAVAAALENAGIDFARNHGWTPHLTLAYTEEPTLAPVDVLGLPLTFNHLVLARGDIPQRFRLGGQAVEQELARVAASIIHVGDYGELCWNPSAGAVWWNAGDADGDGQETTSFAEITNRFLAVDGVRSVEICDECGLPPSPPWTRIPYRALIAAAETPPPADWSPPAADEVLNIESLAQRLRAKSEPARRAVASAVMKEALEGLGLDFDVTNPLVGKLLSGSAAKVSAISQTTRLEVMRAISAAHSEGLSIPKTADLIRSTIKDASAARGRMIARTELGGVVNGGSLAAVQTYSGATGEAYMKRWLTADGAPFPRHEEYDGLDGQTVALEEAFDVGGVALQYPGDDDGPPEEIINCRCTMEYVAAGGGEEGEGEAVEA